MCGAAARSYRPTRPQSRARGRINAPGRGDLTCTRQAPSHGSFGHPKHEAAWGILPVHPRARTMCALRRPGGPLRTRTRIPGRHGGGRNGDGVVGANKEQGPRWWNKRDQLAPSRYPKRDASRIRHWCTHRTVDGEDGTRRADAAELMIQDSSNQHNLVQYTCAPCRRRTC